MVTTPFDWFSHFTQPAMQQSVEQAQLFKTAFGWATQHQIDAWKARWEANKSSAIKAAGVTVYAGVVLAVAAAPSVAALTLDAGAAAINTARAAVTAAEALTKASVIAAWMDTASYFAGFAEESSAIAAIERAAEFINIVRNEEIASSAAAFQP